MTVVGKITPTSRTQIRVKMEYFAKIIQKKGPPIRKKIGNFSPRYSSNYILNEKKKQKHKDGHNRGLSLQNQNIFLLNFEKCYGRPPLFP